jgi:gamma-glutamylaminecyclotransferase
MLIAGPWFAPMMLTEPGEGRSVCGEVFRIDDARLALIDGLESVGQPGHWRISIRVRIRRDGEVVSAFAYLKDRFLADPVHSGLLDSYDDTRFIPPECRASTRHQGALK